MILTNLHAKNYHAKDVVRIVNQKQQLLYVKNRVFPIDMYTSIDDKTGNCILVMIFFKKDTKDVYKKWCDYNLN